MRAPKRTMVGPHGLLRLATVHGYRQRCRGKRTDISTNDTAKKLYGLSRPTIYKMLKAVTFPAPTKIAGKNLWSSERIT